MIGDGRWSHGVCMNPHYTEADQCIYFHGSKIGYKVESLKNAP